ncbi:MAG: hypothetical protein Q4F13_04660 [Pseudomonadota bacterium]|nr:hypothetical protein [Pseudomonadota bacterium]
MNDRVPRPPCRTTPRPSFVRIRVNDQALVRHLRRRHTLWLHGWVMGLLTLGVMAVTSALLRLAGVDALAWRYALALGVGYAVYLLLLRIWAGMLLGEPQWDASVDAPVELPRGGSGSGSGCAGIDAGGGGDFGGGGASGGFDAAAGSDGGGALSEIQALKDWGADTVDAVGSVVGDEGAIVVIPVLAVFGAVLAALLGSGWLLLLYFGYEALLAVAVEVAFAYTAARTVVRIERQGWLLAAIRLSWRPLLGALLCAVVLGALLDHFVPQAHSLPQAVAQLWQAWTRP